MPIEKTSMNVSSALSIYNRLIEPVRRNYMPNLQTNVREANEFLSCIWYQMEQGYPFKGDPLGTVLAIGIILYPAAFVKSFKQSYGSQE